ncbi:AP endonuclease, partial [Mesorhizobium sp. M4A.F.Ca.ET.029.04.2.1]
SATRLEETGSDHLPVLVEFSLRAEEKKPDDEHETALAAMARFGKTRG